MRKVGSFEAKTHFSALVEAAEHGETVVITRKGRPVAQMGPVAPRSQENAREILDRILARQIRIGIAVRELVEEGRRW
jgi:prevent-host-death family protein